MPGVPFRGHQASKGIISKKNSLEIIIIGSPAREMAIKTELSPGWVCLIGAMAELGNACVRCLIDFSGKTDNTWIE